jgi:uncharacterized membrane protein
MDKLKKIAGVIALCFLTMIANAQETGTGGVMYSNGKIYVVMAVVVTIVIGLFLYLLSLDRKISKMEKKS